MAGKPSEDSTRDGVEGKYANYFQIGYNTFEFLLDFGQLYADGRQERIHTRIITSPAYAKELLQVLWASIEQYEQKFGPLSNET